MDNLKIAEIFNEIADMLELDVKQDRHFEIVAYRKAAETLSTLQEDIAELYSKQGLNGLMDLPGIGKGLSEKIEEYIKTKHITKYEELKKKYPIDFSGLTNVVGMGPKKAYKLYKKAGVKDLQSLKEAIEGHKIRGIEGFGPKSEEEMAKGISLLEKHKGRLPLGIALPEAVRIRDILIKSGLVEKAIICGSTRRMRETVGDLDILVISKKNNEVMDLVCGLAETESVMVKGPTKTTIWLKIGLSCDIRVVEPESIGAAMQYFTGNKEHNVKVRQVAIKKGYKLSEYGLFDSKNKNLAFSEEEVYAKLGFDWMEPEMRTDHGELKLAAAHKLPKLVKQQDILGDLHTHSSHTDGQNTIEEMANQAMAMDYKYIGLTDHSKNERIARGMDDAKFLKYFAEIDKLNGKFDDKFKILKSGEVDILKDGSLDLEPSTLKQMDYVLAAVHSNTKMSKEDMTSRICKALASGYPIIFGHPTDRLINRRDPIDFDFDKILQVCEDNNVVLEVNGHPGRFDLNEENIFRARSYKVKFSIDTDSHSVQNLQFMRYGIGMAKRGWLTKKDVINTKTLRQLAKFFLM